MTINTETQTTPEPASAKWWATRDRSTWERIKVALHRDWEKTKNDFKSDAGLPLDQNAADTVKQMMGKQMVPDDARANLSLSPEDEANALEFGHYARHAYGHRYTEWSDELDAHLARDWADTNPERRYDDHRHVARFGYEHGARLADTPS